MNTNDYNPQEIEKKWQQYWQENNTYKVENNVEGKENFYALSEFAYPSGNLHVGHWYAFAVPDIYARYKRMSGYNVLYPMGFDAFGLPAENAAIKRGLDPRKWTYENMDYMRNQLKSMGASFDWDRSFATCDPEYYKWTQWMFTEFFKNDLVYRDITKVNWDPVDKTILANEQVIDGKSERSGAEVIQKDMAQWMLKITDFADDLIDDLDTLDWDHSIKSAQREWIGRKEGSLIPFKVSRSSVVTHFFGEDLGNAKSKNFTKAILVNEQGEILIQKYENGLTDLPGGALNENETAREAMLRELKEETDYDSFIYQDQISISQISYHSFRDKIDYTGSMYGFVYHVDSQSVSEKQLDEHELPFAELWMKPQDAYDGFSENSAAACAMKQLIADYINSSIEVFTTRADTLYGATYVVLAPEHDLVQNLKSQIANWDEVEEYLKQVEKKSDLDRQQSKEKTGVQLKGISAKNPATGESIPVWIADYVLAHFGTGAVMAVPAHDERDCEFALKYDLPFRFVVLPSAGDIGNSRSLVTSGENGFIASAGVTEEKGSQEQINAEWNAMYDVLSTLDDGLLPVGKRFCCAFEGKVINASAEVNTKTSKEARKIITESVNGEITKTYRLRDWGISRQRYWGCPIPIVYDPEGNAHPVPEEHLPWTLPNDVDFTPDGTAPLARSEELKKRTEEIFGAGWTPEVDTMDTFVDSSWYFYRYLDAQNSEKFASPEALDKWMPVDMYFGGAEHTTMHLLYSRFWVKALHKLGLAPANEPYKARLNRGLILGTDGLKMSKSKGNVIDPDEVVSHVGSDTVRMYLAFIGPFNEPGNYPWDPNGVVGVRRFLDRVWRLQNNTIENSSDELISELHQTIKKVGEDIDRLKLNTAISAMMTFVNKVEKSEGISRNDYDLLIQLLAPFAPHMCEELWMQNHDVSVHHSLFPEPDDSKIMNSMKALPIQINGKVRAKIVVEENESSNDLQNRITELAEVKKWIDGKDIKKFIHVPGKIINLVV